MEKVSEKWGLFFCKLLKVLDQIALWFIGFAIAFPHSNIPNNAVAYVVNRIAEFAETEDNFDNEDDNNYDGE